MLLEIDSTWRRGFWEGWDDPYYPPPPYLHTFPNVLICACSPPPPHLQSSSICCTKCKQAVKKDKGEAEARLSAVMGLFGLFLPFCSKIVRWNICLGFWKSEWLERDLFFLPLLIVYEKGNVFLFVFNLLVFVREADNKTWPILKLPRNVSF